MFSHYMGHLVEQLKRIHRSLTIWFNSIIGTVVVLLPTAQDSFPQLHDYIHPSVYKWGMAVLIIGNIALRFKTTADLADKGKPRDTAAVS